jgi:hypothetical protein
MENYNQPLEEKYRVVERQRAFGQWFKKNMSWIILIIASVLFIFKEGLELSRSQDDVITLIMNMAFTYFFALYISVSMRAMGKKSGKESNSYISSLQYLGDAKKQITDIMYLVPKFCSYKNDKTLLEVKKLFIEENGLSHKLWENGYYDKPEIFDELSEFQKKALQSLDKIKITKLMPSQLLSEHSKSNLKYFDPLYLGKDERTDATQSTRNMIITKSFFPIITSYFAIQVVLGASLIWGAIQVAIIMLMGMFHYLEGEDYILNELRNRQINKADLLIDFKNLYDNKIEIFEDEINTIKQIEIKEEA